MPKRRKDRRRRNPSSAGPAATTSAAVHLPASNAVVAREAPNLVNDLATAVATTTLVGDASPPTTSGNLNPSAGPVPDPKPAPPQQTVRQTTPPTTADDASQSKETPESHAPEITSRTNPDQDTAALESLILYMERDLTPSQAAPGSSPTRTTNSAPTTDARAVTAPNHGLPPRPASVESSIPTDCPEPSKPSDYTPTKCPHENCSHGGNSDGALGTIGKWRRHAKVHAA